MAPAFVIWPFDEKGELMGEKKADEKDCPTNLEPTG
jgi:hypothetical protein